MGTTLAAAFKNLARVAVFLEHVTIEENLVDENISFETELQILQDASDTGLHWLLCSVHQAIHVTGHSVNHDVMNELNHIRVPNVDRDALRHVRDYLVLRDFERLLRRLSIEFAVLRYVYLYN